jgi:hypothetical protein
MSPLMQHTINYLCIIQQMMTGITTEDYHFAAYHGCCMLFEMVSR